MSPAGPLWAPYPVYGVPYSSLEVNIRLCFAFLILILGASLGLVLSHRADMRHASALSADLEENAAEGNGLVFNPGERVEGYSNLLYVAALTLVALAGSAKARPRLCP